ncbi:MAG: peptidylprolyl isomerase [Luteibaculaceae bacterium]
MQRLLTLGLSSVFLLVSMVLEAQKKKVDFVEITTSLGKIVVQLYDETPLHKENFVVLANDGFYDSCSFHRVINNFMIQGGDPNTKPTGSGKDIGNGGPGYNLPAEFVAEKFHKKGALAAARLGDQMNPEKNSSGSQFYIVQGKTFTIEELKNLESQRNRQLKGVAINKMLAMPEYAVLNEKVRAMAGNKELTQEDQLRIVVEVDAALEESKLFIPFEFTAEMIETYTTVGGTPHLDGEYTVFGEVVEGLEVVDAIAQSPVNGSTPNPAVYFSAKPLKKWKPAKVKKD